VFSSFGAKNVGPFHRCPNVMSLFEGDQLQRKRREQIEGKNMSLFGRCPYLRGPYFRGSTVGLLT